MAPRKRGAAVKRPANGVKAQTTTQSRSDEASNVGELTVPHLYSVRETERAEKKENVTLIKFLVKHGIQFQ